MSAPRRIVLAPAGSPEIGGGHVMRAIALADALGARGGVCTLAVAPYGAALAAHFGGDVLRVHVLPTAGGLRAAVAEIAPDVLVIDDYAADAETVEAMGATRPGVAVIDDLADRRHACELLVDPGYGRAPEAYAALVPDGCRVLTGPTYAMLRPGFGRAAPRPAASPSVGRVFVSLGLSDVDAVTARVVERLRAAAPGARLDVALASEAPSLPALRARAKADANLALHVAARDVAGLMSRADVGVGAGGASTWERCALGLPSLAVIVADNQRRVVRALEADGVLLACDLQASDFDAAFDDAWDRLQRTTTRDRLAARGPAICDGRGAGRVAEAILQL